MFFNETNLKERALSPTMYVEKFGVGCWIW